tara:strand:- start:1237 stop:1824 length:588 start_codon:yes stop_codon:yes gene_type:complete
MQSIVWELDNLEALDGCALEASGQPVVIDCPYGKAIEFDGKQDAVFIDSNPLAGLRSFTAEVIFRPDAGGLAEQRFFHLGEADGNRVLFETRLTGDGHWYLDTFISSGTSTCALLNEGILHPVGEWYHLALTCDGREEANFVNGVKEASGAIDFASMEGGRTAVGVRLNRVCWFKGAIGRIRFTPEVLVPEEFMQ